MIKNKQGMSAVITTLIIILLVIVALGIIWVVVKNVINSGVKQVDLATKCRPVEINAVKLAAINNSGNYSVTLSRTGAGEAIAGVKVVISNGTSYSNVTDFGYALAPLETKTEEIDTNVVNATKIEITPYFKSDLGETQLCQNTITTNF